MKLEVPPASFYPGKEFFAGYELPLRVIHVEPSPAFPRHRHGFNELVVACAGSGRHIVDDAEYEMRPGDVFLIPRGSFHEYSEPRKLGYINVLFEATALFGDEDWPAGPDSFACASASDRGTRYFRLSPFGLREVVGIINRMDQELFQLRGGYAFMARALFMQLWATLARKCERSSDEGESSTSRLERLLELLERESASRISVEDMAREAGTCVRNFHRVFKGLTGSTPLVYLNMLRVEKARALLDDGDRTVAQIASLVGYEDGNYFARQFKRFVGCSPSRYRERSLRKGKGGA
jgi:AraC family transcriptional regulator, L-rhamnose operon transcriptional activator RhaR